MSKPDKAPKRESVCALSDENYIFLQREIYRNSGIVLDDEKHYLLEARLLPLVQQGGFSSLDELCKQLRSAEERELRRKVTEALTTNETLFFRDMAPFTALRQSVIADVLAGRQASHKLRIWSAAASSGQEAYSIAMLLLEMKLSSRPLEILGTDLSEQILGRAREARYCQFEVSRGLPADYLARYFERTGRDWQLQQRARDMVSFRQFDLRLPLSELGVFDVIFCRNVLIYFDAATKDRVLDQLLGVTAPGGYLFLGNAETVLRLSDQFQRVTIGSTVAYRKRDRFENRIII